MSVNKPAIMSSGTRSRQYNVNKQQETIVCTYAVRLRLDMILVSPVHNQIKHNKNAHNAKCKPDLLKKKLYTHMLHMCVYIYTYPNIYCIFHEHGRLKHLFSNKYRNGSTTTANICQ